MVIKKIYDFNIQMFEMYTAHMQWINQGFDTRSNMQYTSCCIRVSLIKCKIWYARHVPLRVKFRQVMW